MAVVAAGGGEEGVGVRRGGGESVRRAGVVRLRGEGAEAAEVVVGVEAGVVAVAPGGLDGVPADGFDADEVGSARAKGAIGTFVEIPEDVPFPGAGGTGAVSTESKEGNETFLAVGPADGEFGADDLEVGGVRGIRHGGRAWRIR